MKVCWHVQRIPAFSPFSHNVVIICATFSLSSANAFILDQSPFFLFGRQLYWLTTISVFAFKCGQSILLRIKCVMVTIPPSTWVFL